MAKQLWINLPVSDVAGSRDFFTGIGFSLNERYGNSDKSAAVVFGDQNVVVMLFRQDVFTDFTKNELPAAGTEVLFSFGAENREEVDETAAKVRASGGTIFSEPGEIEGWMYGFGFVDHDGHRWNQLFMDMSRMPQG